MPARLLIIGEGEERATIESRIAQLQLSDSVAMPGFVSNPLPYVKAAALFVLSSKTEGFGLVLAEALACGTPVVSTDCKFGPSEILDGGTHGRLVAVGDTAALASAMEAALNEEPDRPALSARGNHFSLQRSVEEYLRLFGMAGDVAEPARV
jgi:glycosyltransferase involved in cell wall biosynthesis